MKDTAPTHDPYRDRAIREASTPEVAAYMAWAFDEIDRINAGYRTQQPKAARWMIPAHATAADTICHTCRGSGTLTDTHAYGDPTICPCHRCGGTGIKP